MQRPDASRPRSKRKSQRMRRGRAIELARWLWTVRLPRHTAAHRRCPRTNAHHRLARKFGPARWRTLTIAHNPWRLPGLFRRQWWGPRNAGVQPRFPAAILPAAHASRNAAHQRAGTRCDLRCEQLCGPAHKVRPLASRAVTPHRIARRSAAGPLSPVEADQRHPLDRAVRGRRGEAGPPAVGQRLAGRVAAGGPAPCRAVCRARRPELLVYVVPDAWIEQIVGFDFHRGVLACGRGLPAKRLADLRARRPAPSV